MTVRCSSRSKAICKNADAVALGRLGGRKGGLARAAALSPARRSEIARNAGLRRRGWVAPVVIEEPRVETLHPLIVGLIQVMPEVGTAWSMDAREDWLNLAAMIFRVLYRDEPDAPRIVVQRRELSVQGTTGSVSSR